MHERHCRRESHTFFRVADGLPCLTLVRVGKAHCKQSDERHRVELQNTLAVRDGFAVLPGMVVYECGHSVDDWRERVEFIRFRCRALRFGGTIEVGEEPGQKRMRESVARMLGDHSSQSGLCAFPIPLEDLNVAQ